MSNEASLKIGYSQEELNEVRSSASGRMLRFTAFILFWAAWAGMLSGATAIIIVNNHDINATTVMPATTPSKLMAQEAIILSTNVNEGPLSIEPRHNAMQIQPLIRSQRIGNNYLNPVLNSQI